MCYLLKKVKIIVYNAVLVELPGVETGGATRILE